jgi:hypothetical protein
MGLTVGELNVQLEASTKEFREALDEVAKRVEDIAGTTEQGTERAGNAFRNFGVAVSAAGVAINAASLAGFTFGKTLTRIALVIPGLRVLLIGLGAVLGLLALRKFANRGIELAASFEQVAVALETLTGSAETAQTVLAEVNKIVLETPFGLNELANVARQLAIVFGDDADAISEFTRITADIAAVSGKSVEQIGGQIQRAVTSGLGAAEVLREAGITALLLEQAGATDVAALRGEALLEAFRGLTAEGGKAFGAAARQALTLTGALSNAEIAQNEFNRAFGDALAPTTITRAKNTQDAFVALREVVIDLTPAIRAIATIFSTIFNFAVDASVAAIRALIIPLKQLELALAVVQVIIVGFAAAVDITFKAALNAIIGLFRLLTGDIEGARQAFAEIGSVIEDSPVVTLLTNVLMTASVAAEDLLNSMRGLLRAVPIFGALAEAIGFSTENTDKFARSQEKVAKETEEVTERTEAEVEALEELNKVLRDVGGETGIDRIRALDQEIIRVSLLKTNLQDATQQGRVLTLLAQERTRLAQLEVSASQGIRGTLARVNEQIAALSEIDPAAATDFAISLSEALTGAGTELTDQIVAAAEVSQSIRDFEQADRLQKEKEAADERERLQTAADREIQTAREALVSGLRVAQLAAITDETIRRIAVLNDEIAAVEELGRITGDRALAEEQINLLIEQRVALEADLAAQQAAERQARAQLPQTLAAINQQIAELAEIDPERATRFALDLQRALVQAGDDPQALLKAATNLAQRLREELATLEVPTLGQSIGQDVFRGISDALTGQDFNFGQTLADSLTEFGQPALDKLFEEAVADFGKAFEGAIQAGASFLEGLDLGGAGGGIFSGIGDFFDSAAGKASIGLIGQGISTALKFGDEDISASAARNIQSAVTSVQAVRGIVAGPTQIAVAQVDRAISDAFVETNLILRRIEANTRASAANGGRGGDSLAPPDPNSDATRILIGESESLI